ncbi:MAG: PilW family protein [Pseudomonadota bacterium]
MNTRLRHSSLAQRQSLRGFSLVELMVALAIGLILIAGLATLFANSSQTGNEVDKSIRQIENGRYAAELLSENVGIAGYYGELVRDGMTVATPSPATLCATTITSLGWDNAASTIPVAVTGLTAAQAAALTCLSNYKAGTAALVLRYVDTTAVAPGASTNGSPYLQTSRCTTDPNATKLVFSTISSDFTLRGLNCTAINTVQRYVVRIYYVASCNECGIDTTPTLKRAELVGNQMVVAPLAEGIEEVAFDYGFDTNNDGIPDVYLGGLSGVAAAADNDWNNVVGMRLHMLTRTTETSPGFVDSKTYDLGLAGTRGPFNDAYKRRAYTVTVRISNVAGPREIP